VTEPHVPVDQTRRDPAGRPEQGARPVDEALTIVKYIYRQKFIDQIILSFREGIVFDIFILV
jgi:hypothetical protein